MIKFSGLVVREKVSELYIFPRAGKSQRVSHHAKNCKILPKVEEKSEFSNKRLISLCYVMLSKFLLKFDCYVSK